MSATADLWLLILLASAASYLWRGLGVLLSARIDPHGATFEWVSCISYAMLAGLVARMIVMPLGALAEAPLVDRLGAMGLAILVFFACRRSILAGVAAGAVALMILATARDAQMLG